MSCHLLFTLMAQFWVRIIWWKFPFGKSLIWLLSTILGGQNSLTIACVRVSEWVNVCECIAIKRQSKLGCMPIHLEQFERVLFSQISNADTYICIASLGSAWAFFNDGVLIMCNYFWYNVVDEYLKSGTDKRDSILACNFGKSSTLLNL